MFGSSNAPATENNSSNNTVDTSTDPAEKDNQSLLKSPTEASPAAADNEKSRQNDNSSPQGRKSEESPSGGKNRRSTGVSKAKDIFTSAKQSLHLHGSSSPSASPVDKTPQTAMQKLSRSDPALSVPQGSLNNSAGESAPGPRSTFRVGVTEDKNKKCRRTMEDTHAYLYNFLSTPAPSLGSGNGSSESETIKKSSDAASNEKDSEVTDVSDQQIVETDNGYFAIFDGHAGTFAADWCGKKLHLLLEETIRKNPNTPIPELLDQTFTLVDQQLEKLPLKNSGCTAVIAVLRWEDRIPNSQSATGSTSIAPAAASATAKSASEPNVNPSQIVEDSKKERPSNTNVPDSATPTTAAPIEAKLRESASRQRVLYTANVGDARIVLSRSGKALRLSYDHKGSDENEGKRIANAGGLILNNRVNGVLAVTRALGDAYMKDLVTGHPYTTETVIQPDMDEFLILACDGLWDVCSDQEAVDLVRSEPDPQAASKKLVDHALSRFSTDNLSCMIVRFDSKAVQNTVERKAEPIGVEGDPASSQGGITETELLVSQGKKHMGTDVTTTGGDTVGESEEDASASAAAAAAAAVASPPGSAGQPPPPQLNPDAPLQAMKSRGQG